MKISHSFEAFQGARHAVVTTGTFDGVHFGHQKIIARMQETAQAIDGETVIITFFPHPRMILHPEDQQLKLLNSLPEKIGLLENLGIDHLLVVPFSRDFSNMSSAQFVRSILVDRLQTARLVIGYDHRFGKDREGNFESLVKMGPSLGFQVEEIPEQDINDIAVSSTKIRVALAAGDLETANAYLQYAYRVSGTVVKGDQIGRTLGYPTANIHVEEPSKLIPREGIYSVWVVVNQHRYQGMLYIGRRPVLGKVNRTIEVNIFEFDKDIYGQDILVEFHEFIRPDANFPNLDALKIQMGFDKVAVLKTFSSG